MDLHMKMPLDAFAVVSTALGVVMLCFLCFWIYSRKHLSTSKSKSNRKSVPNSSGFEAIMTGLAPTSSSFSYQWTYDVFMNFRGEDTRHGFTGHLYNALKKAGVRTFFDDEEIRRGNEITPTLLKAIENSRMAITIFSNNYASSTFCLNELVKIHECIKMKGRLVLPIFYDVDPSTVRHQKDNYKQALSTHMINLRADEDKIQSWKLALHEVANISGDHFIHGQNGYEYQFIEKIVNEISSKINRVPLHVSDYPIGLELRVKKLYSLLQIESSEVAIMVGICGMGGLGKTTIARALYNSVADNFESVYFAHDVKEKSMKVGLERMQETILSKILGVDIKIQDVNEGVEVIKLRLKQLKILLILDNVDNHEQLKKLAGGCNWFSGGSRIIITTRDKQLLVSHGVQSIYNMEALNRKESLELLSWNAFRNPQVDPNYKDVLNCAITYAQGLPLALEVIGSNLCGKPTNEWESALDAYKLIPNRDIQQVLKVSYDGLEQDQKEIFLDIACFFKGEKLEYVKYMVEAVRGNTLSYSIAVLVDKCLIKVVNRHIEMHDLIRDMGREIVREESPNKPGKQSRLWFHQDIVDVLEDNTGTDEIGMIVQENSSKCIEVNWDGEAFRSMKNLKILIFENVKFSENPKYLPNSLMVLKWRRYPSSSWPPRFCPKKLVVLDIGQSYLSSLETIKTSNNLRVLNLEACQYVTEIPDLSNLQNLKELNLKYCDNLIGIHDSVGYLAKLEILDAGYCLGLKTFPHAIKSPSLRELNLVWCSNMKYFPEILEEVKIRELNLIGTRIEKLPWSICNVSKMRQLWIDQDMLEVIEIPNSIFLLPEIEEMRIYCNDGKVMISCNSKEAQQHAIWSKQCAKGFVLELPRCNISDDLLRTHISRFINVKHLDLTGNNFTILPSWIKQCHSLRVLLLNECKHLREVEGIPPRIERLEATNCASLSSESKSLILSEELHGRRIHGRYYSSAVTYLFCVPSRSMPEWFEHRRKGASISFWFRNSICPTLCFCLLLKPTYGVLYPPHFNLLVSVNNIEEHSLGLPSFDDELKQLDGDHLVLYHLTEYHRRCCYVREGHEWNHVELEVFQYSFPVDQMLDVGVVIEESGIYVIKQRFDMQNISFHNPYTTLLDSTSDIQETSDDDEIREISDDDGGDDIYYEVSEISSSAAEEQEDDHDDVVDTISKYPNNDGDGERSIPKADCVTNNNSPDGNKSKMNSGKSDTNTNLDWREFRDELVAYLFLGSCLSVISLFFFVALECLSQVDNFDFDEF